MTATLLDGTTEVATATPGRGGDNMTVEITGLLPNQVEGQTHPENLGRPLSTSFFFRLSQPIRFPQ